jgi:hypothetical protein
MVPPFNANVFELIENPSVSKSGETTVYVNVVEFDSDPEAKVRYLLESP